jgi:hypothetical protein
MTRPATPKQVATIEKCLPGGEWAKKMDEHTEVKIREMLTAGMTIGQASAWMDWLFAPAQRLPRGGERNDTVTITEPGFYLYQDEAYRVQKTRDGQRLYAKKATSSGWNFEAGKGVVFRLAPEMLMTAMEIASFGGRKGFCVNCSDGLSDPISKKIGLGTKCGPDIMGNEAYRAARKHHIATDAECAAHDAQLKASAKARREAAKAQAAKEVVAA